MKPRTVTLPRTIQKRIVDSVVKGVQRQLAAASYGSGSNDYLIRNQWDLDHYPQNNYPSSQPSGPQGQGQRGTDWNKVIQGGMQTYGEWKAMEALGKGIKKIPGLARRARNWYKGEPDEDENPDYGGDENWDFADKNPYEDAEGTYESPWTRVGQVADPDEAGTYESPWTRVGQVADPAEAGTYTSPWQQAGSSEPAVAENVENIANTANTAENAAVDAEGIGADFEALGAAF